MCCGRAASPSCAVAEPQVRHVLWQSRKSAMCCGGAALHRVTESAPHHGVVVTVIVSE